MCSLRDISKHVSRLDNEGRQRHTELPGPACQPDAIQSFSTHQVQSLSLNERKTSSTWLGITLLSDLPGIVPYGIATISSPLKQDVGTSCWGISSHHPDGTKMQPCRMSRTDVQQGLRSNMKWAPGIQPRPSWKTSETDTLLETARELKILAQTV